MKKYLFLFIISIIASLTYSQTKFPVPVRNGDSLKIFSKKKVYNIPVKNDTLWILKNSQLQNAIIKAKKLELSEQEISELKNEINLYNKQSTEKDSLISIVKKDRNFYQNSWKTCDGDLEKVLRMQKRQSLYTKLAIAGIPVAFVIGLFIAL